MAHASGGDAGEVPRQRDQFASLRDGKRCTPSEHGRAGNGMATRATPDASANPLPHARRPEVPLMVVWRRVLRTALALVMVLGGVSATGGVARAQNEGAAGPTPPRLSFVDGEVSFWRPGAEDWAPAQVNTPLAAGDSLYAGDGANLELQIGPHTFVRAGSGTDLGLESLDPDLVQFKITAG